MEDCTPRSADWLCSEGDSSAIEFRFCGNIREVEDDDVATHPFEDSPAPGSLDEGTTGKSLEGLEPVDSKFDKDAEVPKGLRHYVHEIVAHKHFQQAVISAIILNTAAMVLESEKPAWRAGLQIMDFVFTAFFTFEMLMKWAAFGITQFFASKFNWLDFVVVVESLVSVIMHLLRLETVDLSVLRTIRVLRPLRSVSHIAGLKAVVRALFLSISSISYTLLLYIACLLFFAQLFLAIFNGSFDRTCHGLGFEDEVFCGVEEDACATIGGLLVPFDCFGNSSQCQPTNEPPNFPNYDNMGETLFTLFRIGTLDGWNSALWGTQNAVGESSLALFALFIVIGPCVVMNICIAGMIRDFSDAVAATKQDMQIRGVVQEHKPHLVIERFPRLNAWIIRPLTECWRNRCYRGLPEPKYSNLKHIVMDDASCLNIVVMSAIAVNILCLGLEQYPQSAGRADFLAWLGVFWNVFFLFELIGKLIVVGMDFYEGDVFWANFRDTIIVAASSTELLFIGQESGGNSDGAGSMLVLRIVRLSRLARAGRIIKTNPALRLVVGLLSTTMNSAWPVLLLTVIAAFIFAILGMQLFGDDDSLEGSRLNFNSFPAAMMQVILILLMEDWGDVYDAVIREGDGNFFKQLYFIVLIVIGQMLLLNLVLAAIVDGAFEQFDHSYEEEEIRQKLISALNSQAIRPSFEHWKQVAESMKRKEEEEEQDSEVTADSWGPESWTWTAANFTTESPGYERNSPKKEPSQHELKIERRRRASISSHANLRVTTPKSQAETLKMLGQLQNVKKTQEHKEKMSGKIASHLSKLKGDIVTGYQRFPEEMLADSSANSADKEEAALETSVPFLGYPLQSRRSLNCASPVPHMFRHCVVRLYTGSRRWRCLASSAMTECGTRV